ncbi:MAG: GNAT family N-acetyltransferase [Porticoccaceae bacterium]
MTSYPFLSPAFFAALEDSGSAVAATGWEPRHQVIRGDAEELAFMPLYLKSHSYGEYVFDWSWADAYQRSGLRYYPKLLSAVPFTPASGPRARFANSADPQALAAQLVAQALAVAEENRASSWHLLFPDEAHLALFQEPRLLHRRGVQYHWFNRGYEDFAHFLAGFNSRKRKMVRRERREVQESGLRIEQHSGAQITPALWHQFASFYQHTYRKRSGSRGYLTPAFFTHLGESMAEQCLLVTASQGEQVVAAAFYLFDADTLYGRYWGCHREFDFLHFELCYYQGIEFAIRRGMRRFDAGAQGEHKILRGFEPVMTHSLHWLAEPAFQRAVARFLEEEALHIHRHMNEARRLLPYREGSEQA